MARAWPTLRRRGRPTEQFKAGKESALLASGARLTLADLDRVRGRRSGTPWGGWQAEAFTQYNLCGELRTGVRWKANSLSRSTLYIAEGDTTVPEPARVDEGHPVELLQQLFNGPGGQSQMLRSLGAQLSVPGECYLVSFKDPDRDGELTWVVASVRELKKDGSGWVLDRGDGRKISLAEGPNAWVLRIWNSHIEKWWWPDSATYGVLPVLREMEALAQHVLATVDSRLAGAGLLTLPKEATFPDPANPEKYKGMDPFTATLVEAMTTPLQNRDSAAAVVPIVVRIPGETVKGIEHITFSTPLDERIMPMRENGIKRLALGLDMPPEALLGMSDANHWTGWLLTDEGVRLHIEPDLAAICDALTMSYLWPLLVDLVPDPTRYTIWYDTSELTQRPDRGPDAREIYDRGELGRDPLLRHHGFDPAADAPSLAERRERILLEVAKAQPAFTEQLLIALNVIAPGQLAGPAPAEPTRVPSQRGDEPQLEGPPARGDDQQTVDTGEPPVQASAAPDPSAITACNMAVFRALEIVGKRIQAASRAQRSADIHTWEMHTLIPAPPGDHDRLLAGAWGILAAAAPEHAHLVTALDQYVRSLLASGTPHDPARLAALFDPADVYA